MPETYTDGFPAFTRIITKDKHTNLDKVTWRLVKKFAHPWDCEAMALVGAMRAKYYPLAFTSNNHLSNINNEPKPAEEIAA